MFEIIAHLAQLSGFDFEAQQEKSGLVEEQDNYKINTKKFL
jgi:hypothetical protein